MARAGLGDSWKCLFANDFDHKKGASYTKFWGDAELTTEDVRAIILEHLPGEPDLVWASFPCQDLSLAGGGAGLGGDRSGTFWPFWKLIRQLVDDGRAPRIIALENVCGTLTSHGGRDFAAICSAFAGAGYAFGALVIDASLFVPQSRPRLFVIGVYQATDIPREAHQPTPSPLWHPRGLLAAYEIASSVEAVRWVWWSPPVPPT